MATKSKGRTASGKTTTVRRILGGKGGQTRVRRELAAQRTALGSVGVSRAMKNWGLRATKSSPSSKGGAARVAYSGRNG